MIAADNRLAVFLEVFPSAKGDEFVSPPGLGGVWRAGDVRSGLQRQVLVIHHSGRGLAFAAFPAGHKAKDCRCGHCMFEYSLSDLHGKPVSREKVSRLAAQLKAFHFSGPPVQAGFDL